MGWGHSLGEHGDTVHVRGGGRLRWRVWGTQLIMFHAEIKPDNCDEDNYITRNYVFTMEYIDQAVLSSSVPDTEKMP